MLEQLLKQSAELLAKGELEYDEIEAIFQKFGIKPTSRPILAAS